MDASAVDVTLCPTDVLTPVQLKEPLSMDALVVRERMVQSSTMVALVIEQYVVMAPVKLEPSW